MVGLYSVAAPVDTVVTPEEVGDGPELPFELETVLLPELEPEPEPEPELEGPLVEFAPAAEVGLTIPPVPVEVAWR